MSPVASQSRGSRRLDHQHANARGPAVACVVRPRVAIVDVAQYVREFNRGVREGTWSQLAEWFTRDAVLEFVGPPVGPFVGRLAIAAAYEANPPDDEIELAGPPSVLGVVTTVPYRWCTSRTGGTMQFTEQDELVQRLRVVFD